MTRNSILAFLFCTVLLVGAREPLVVKKGLVILNHGTVELVDKNGKKKEYKKQRTSDGYDFPITITLSQGDTLRTGDEADCSIVIPETGTVKLEPKSVVKIPAAQDKGKKPLSSLELLGGKLYLDIDSDKLSKKKKEFRLKTPTTVLAVKGTRFFAEAGGEIETAGVHKGKIEITEAKSQRSQLLPHGNAAMAKTGAISKPRRLTQAENKEADIYQSFAIEFNPGERDHRRFKTSFEAATDPNTAIRSKHPKLIKAVVSEELDTGKAIKITILPIKEAPTVSVFASTEVVIPVRLSSVPVGITFFARGQDIQRFSVTGSLAFRKRTFEVPSRMTLKLPDDIGRDEWIPFYVPLMEKTKDDGRDPANSITFSIDPNLHEGRAIESIVNVEKGKEKYVLEVSPVMVGFRPKE